MIYIFAVLIFVLNTLLIFFKVKNKILLNSLLIFMVFIFFGNDSNPDYNNYINGFNLVEKYGKGSITSQIGYSYLQKFFIKFGCNYPFFRASIFAIGIFLINYTVKKFSMKPNLVYLFYFIYPFLFDVIQVKHFLSMSIVIFSFNYLIENKRTNFFIGIVIAGSIHYISLVFLPLVFIYKMTLKRLYYLVLGINLAFIVIVKTNLLFKIIDIFGTGLKIRISHYFFNRATFIGGLAMIMIRFIVIFYLEGVYLTLRKMKKNNNYLELIYKINIYLLILFPLITINGNFSRAFRIMFIPNYILFSNMFFYSIKKHKLIILVALIMLPLFFFTNEILINSNVKFIKQIFENNIFYKI